MKNSITTKLLLLLLALAIAGVLYYQRLQQSEHNTLALATTTIPTQNTAKDETTLAPVTAASAVSKASPTTDHPGMKLYRNEEFGFEFWYPEGWTWQENVFGNPSIRFNLTLMDIDKKHTNQDEVINVVTEAFANNAVRNYKLMNASVSKVLVGGVYGTEYRYTFEGVPSIDIHIPFGESKILLGFAVIHEKELGNILSTFSFFKD